MTCSLHEDRLNLAITTERHTDRRESKFPQLLTGLISLTLLQCA